MVYDLPSLAPAPDRARRSRPAAGEPLLGDERAAIDDVLTRFLRAYLAGDRGGLAYLVPAGNADRGAATGGFELLELGSLSALGPARAAGGWCWRPSRRAIARRGRGYALRYRVRLVRRDRWYVAAINDAGPEGERR